MKLGKFTLLNFDTLLQLARFFIAEKMSLLALLEEISNKTSNMIGDENITNTTFQDRFLMQLDQLETLLDQLEKSSLSKDEKEILLTGGIIALLIPYLAQIKLHDNQLTNIFTKDKLLDELIFQQLHDDGAAKWESIISYNIFKQDPENYKTYPIRKAEFSSQIKAKYGTNIYGDKIDSEENKVIHTLSFFPKFHSNQELDSNNILIIQGFQFYPYWDLKSTFFNLEEIVKTLALAQQANTLNAILQDPGKIACMEKLKIIFNTLDQAVIPEHDKSLIATGGLLTLSERLSYQDSVNSISFYLDFFIFVKKEKLCVEGKAKQTAIDSYQSYLQNPDEYKIYSQRMNENEELSNVIGLGRG